MGGFSGGAPLPGTHVKILNMEDPTKELLRGEDGYILITDRKKDMIIVGGFNVYPRDVGDILYTFPR